MFRLYIVATPIGNLEDLTFRALRTLKEVDFVLAEDKRVTIKLFNHYDIKTKLITWHEHSKDKDWQRVKEIVQAEKDIALVTDAGTPGLSDPGGKLIELILQEFKNIEIIPIPGPSALAALISIAGILLKRFEFLGFLPHKKGRKSLIEYIKKTKIPIIFYESVHRILKTLESLKDSKQEIIIGRELTKKFETVYRGKAAEILNILKENKKSLKGEFVIIVNKRNEK